MEMLQCHFILASFLVLNGCFFEASCQIVYTYTTKDVESLPCTKTEQTGSVIWDETVEGKPPVRIMTYQRGSSPLVTKSTLEKYKNFNFSLGPTFLNLDILNVEDSDGGVYTCVPLDVSGSRLDVFVEVIPDEISLDCFVPPAVTCPAQGVTPTSELTCTCAATGVRPESLSLDISDAYDVVQDSEGTIDGLFDLSLKATVPVTDSATNVTCSVEGYSTTGEPIPPNLITKTLMISPPTCALYISFDQDCKVATLNCSCSANPTDGESGPGMVFSYFNETDHLIMGATTNPVKINDIEAGVELTYSCRGCNGLYYGDDSYATGSKVCTITTESTTEKSESTTTKKPGPRRLTPGAIIGIIVGVLAVVIVIVVIAVIMYKTGKCGSNSSSDKLDDNGAGPRGDPEIPAYGVVDKNRTKDPTPAPRSSMRDSKNPSNPKQDGPMEMQYADLDHGNKPPSDEVRKPKEEPTEYATVQSVIV